MTTDIIQQFNSMKNSGMFDSYESLKQENKELKRIISDTTELISYIDIESMIKYVTSKMLDHFIPQFMAFLVKPPRNENIRQYCFRKLMPSSDIISMHTYGLLKQYFSDGGANFYFSSILEKIGEDSFEDSFIKLKPYLIIPLKGIGGIYGIVILADKIIGTNYTQTELKYMHHMFSVLSISIQNGLHYESSITEPKTGLLTFDYFEQKMKDLILTSIKNKTALGFLMIDIDFFKKFNDNYGHLVGDKVLINLAQCLVSNSSKDYLICRYGGEEFSILIPNCDEDSLKTFSEKIRKAANEMNITDGENQLSISISIGTCFIEPFNNISTKVIIKKADNALYHSKQNGRNQVTFTKIGLLARSCILNNL